MKANKFVKLLQLASQLVEVEQLLVQSVTHLMVHVGL